MKYYMTIKSTPDFLPLIKDPLLWKPTGTDEVIHFILGGGLLVCLIFTECFKFDS